MYDTERERTVRMILFPIAPVRLLASVKLWKVSPFPHLWNEKPFQDPSPFMSQCLRANVHWVRIIQRDWVLFLYGTEGSGKVLGFQCSTVTGRIPETGSDSVSLIRKSCQTAPQNLNVDCLPVLQNGQLLTFQTDGSMILAAISWL